MTDVPNIDPTPAPPEKTKLVLKGMPFDREELSKATKREFRAAGRNIKWSEARARAYAALLLKHFPRIK